MVKTNSGRFFEDFVVGESLVHPIPRTLTEGDQALYIALTGDRRPLHCSAEFARALGFRRETVNDLLVFHTVFGKTVTDVSLNAVANLGYAGVRFLHPVYPGDTLRSVSEVVGKKENSSGETGIVWVKTVGTNQDGAIVLEFFRWVMVQKRDASVATGAADVPEMPPVVEADRLVVPDALDLGAYAPWVSGGAYFDDYEIRERIDHVDGMTLLEAEHAMATRLYQNTAKVHFDGRAMESSRFGKRLVYGGHVISSCSALSFNGFERALGILGMSSGAHVSPVFAGDTLYAWSEVIDKQPVGGRDDCGGLRVRLVGVKNRQPLEEPTERMVEKDGRERHHPSVVLDLDLWLLMPKRS